MTIDLRFIVMRSILPSNSAVAAALGVLVTLAVAAGASPAAADPAEVGIWYDDTGKGAVKIEICTTTTLCGKIYWLKEPLNTEGVPKTDKHNPEPSMRTRTICGLPVLGDLEQMSDGGFDNGWVYDPKEGNSYSVALDLLAPDKLKVTGYKGLRMLGKSFIWTRAPDDLPACATDAAAAPAKPNAAEKPKKKKQASKQKTTPASKIGAADAASKPSKPKAKSAQGSQGAATQQRPVASN